MTESMTSLPYDIIKKKTPSLPKLLAVIHKEDDQVVIKKNIPIKIAKSKKRFQVREFLDITVNFSIWQLLNRSFQLKIQLTCIMVLSRSTKRRKKSAWPNLVRTAAMTSKFWTPFMIQIITHKDKKVICFYINI